MRFGVLSLDDYSLMKKAGFRMLLFGLESGSQRILDELNKGVKVEEIVDSCKKAKDAGLTVHVTIMFGYPDASREEELQTHRLAKKLMEGGYADTLQSTLLIPYPGSRLYETAIEKDWLRYQPGQWEHWDMSEPVLKSDNVSAEEVKRLCDETYKVFLSRRYVLRRLLSIRSFEDLKFTFRGVRKIIGHIKDFSIKNS
jgi:anaerobic magnesium-protoporphyrin IX monomethyl ester cyclase